MSTRAIGSIGEDFAAEMIQKSGGRVLARNYHGPYGEIDLIVEEEGCIAFVEVKARREGSLTRPAEAVTPKKRRRIIQTAVRYLMEHPHALQPRFDVFEIVMERGKPFSVRSYQHIKNAYEVTNHESI